MRLGPVGMSSRGSTDSEVEAYEDEDDSHGFGREEDELAAGRPYDAPTPDPVTPPATDAADKGKGREETATAQTAGPTSNLVGKAGGTARERVEDLLASLERIESTTLDTLVNLDPKEVSALSTTTKLMKALVLLQRPFQEPPAPAPAPASAYVHQYPLPPSPRPPASATYIALIELVASALADVSAPTPAAGAREARKRSEYDLAAARAKLAVEQGSDPSRRFSFEPYEDPVGPSPFRFTPRPLAQTTAPKADDALDADLAALLLENTQLMLLKLRPSFLPNPALPVQPPPLDPTLTPPASSCPIGKLPFEILAEIIRLARKLAEERPVDQLPLGHSGDPYELIRPAARVRRGGGWSSELAGSRTAAQKFVHSLALVSRTWRETSRSIAYGSVHLRKKSQLPKLLDVLAREECDDWKDHVVSVNIKLPVTSPDAGVVGSLRGSRAGTLARHLAPAYGWGQQPAPSATTSAQRLQEETDNPSVHFGRLVAACPALQHLTLTVIGYAYSIPFGARHQTTDFLDPQVLATLSSLTSLSSLTLGTSVDFEELEVILAGMPNLQELYLEGGFDDVNGGGVVVSEAPHPARLRTLVIGNGQTSYRDYTSITDVQLAFLLEPAVATMRHLDITIMSSAGGGGMIGWAVGGGGGGGNQVPIPPSFASGLFADLLVRMGPRIERLALRDLQAFGGFTPSLAQAPHSGTFDHALSHCTALRELSLQFQYTGAGLLDALLPSGRSLESLLFLGTPTAMPADDLADRIELGVQFPVLRRLVVSGQYVGRGPAGAGWTGPQVRRLKAVTKEKGVLCVLAT